MVKGKKKKVTQIRMLYDYGVSILQLQLSPKLKK